MATSRLTYIARNVVAVWLAQLVGIVGSLVVRVVFARYLSQEYLGLETLFSNVIMVLSLAELGVGSAIVFSLYGPLARKDQEAIKSIMRLFRRAYTTIGCVVGLVGCIICPFLEFFIDQAPDIPYLKIYFLFFVFNSAISYFFSYKGALITADQKNYIVTIIRCVTQLVMYTIQTVILILTQDYLFFLTCMLLCTLGQNITISVTANRLYPFLKDKNIQPINKQVLRTIKRNVSGMVIHKASSVANAPVNTVFTSSILGLVPVAIYGNYIMVITVLSGVIEQAFNSITASAGNLVATETEDRQYKVFDLTLFVGAFLYGPLTVCILCLVNPFIEMLFGANYLFPIEVVPFFAMLFYFRGIRMPVLTFISAHGLYWQTRLKALAEIIVLLISVPIMTTLFGMIGLLLANIFVQIFISIYFEGKILHRAGFNRRSGEYFKALVRYALVTAFVCGAAWVIMSFFPADPIFRFFVGGVFCVIFGFGVFAIIYWRKPEFIEVKTIMLNGLNALASKLKRRKAKEERTRK